MLLLLRLSTTCMLPLSCPPSPTNPWVSLDLMTLGFCNTGQPCVGDARSLPWSKPSQNSGLHSCSGSTFVLSSAEIQPFCMRFSSSKGFGSPSSPSHPQQLECRQFGQRACDSKASPPPRWAEESLRKHWAGREPAWLCSGVF